MTKRVKNILIIGCILLIIAIYILVDVLSRRTYYSAEGELGNTSGNIYNEGLFCENDGRIYFSNYLDDGTLYSMSTTLDDYEKLYSDKVSNINADENYLFYSRLNYKKDQSAQSLLMLYRVGLFRIKKTGSGIKMLQNEPVGSLMLYNNSIYYQHFTEKNGLELYCMDIAGEDEGYILEPSEISPAGIRDGVLYYTGITQDHGIHTLNLSNASSSMLLDTYTYMPVPVSDGILFISTKENYSICKMDYDGANKTTLVEGMVSTYNISADERYIYYQRDGGDSNGIYVYDTVTGTEVSVILGDYKWINVAANHVFFYDYEETTVYVYTDDGSLSTFSPEIEE